MKWPQILIIVLAAVDLGYAWAKHGQTHEKEHDVLVTFIAQVVILGILWLGGFFG